MATRSDFSVCGKFLTFLLAWPVVVSVLLTMTLAGCDSSGTESTVSDGGKADPSRASASGPQSADGGSATASSTDAVNSNQQAADPQPAEIDDGPNRQQVTLTTRMAPDEFTAPAPVAPEWTDWLMFRGDPLATGVSTAKIGDKFQVAWEMKIQNGGFDGSPIIHDGTVFVAEGRGVLYALDLNTGEKQWQYPPPESSRELLGFIASPAIANDRIYIGDLNGILHCLTLAGKPDWEFETEVSLTSSVNFYKDAVIVGGEDARLYCIDAATGEQRWAFEAADQIRCMPTIADGQAFVTGCDGNLHVIDLETGKESMMVELESPTIASPAVLGESVFFGTGQKGFVAIAIEQGELSWTFPDGNQIFSSPAVIAKAGRKQVIYGSRMRKVYSLDGDSGDVQWEHDTDRDVDASPIIVGDRVLAASTGGMLYWLDLETGETVYEKRFPGGLIASPAVTDGRLIVATGRGSVYCLVNPLATD